MGIVFGQKNGGVSGTVTGFGTYRAAGGELRHSHFEREGGDGVEGTRPCHQRRLLR